MFPRYIPPFAHGMPFQKGRARECGGGLGVKTVGFSAGLRGIPCCFQLERFFYDRRAPSSVYDMWHIRASVFGKLTVRYIADEARQLTRQGPTAFIVSQRGCRVIVRFQVTLSTGILIEKLTQARRS